LLRAAEERQRRAKKILASEGIIAMNAPFVVAQAVTTGQGITTGQNSATPPKVVKLVKPQGEQAIVIQMDGSTKLDFTGIAGENITLVRVGERLVILFDNKSTVTIEPFFDSSGKPLQIGGIELEGNKLITGEEFAALFPITDDQSVLPAAGEANSPQNTGGQFAGPNVDPLSPMNPLDLLPQEELPNWVSEVDTAPLDTAALNNGLLATPLLPPSVPPGVSGSVGSLLVRESHLDLFLDPPSSPADIAAGLVEGTDPQGRGETTESVTGEISNLTFTAGSGAINSIVFADPNVQANPITVKDEAGNPIAVFWKLSSDGTRLEGFLDAAMESSSLAIVLQISPTQYHGDNVLEIPAIWAAPGASVSPIVTVTLTKNFPHSDTNDGGDGDSNRGLDDLVTLDGFKLIATDTNNLSVTSDPFSVGVADDAPEVGQGDRDWTLDEDVLPLTGNDALDNPSDPNDYLVIDDKNLGVNWGADGARAVTFVATDAHTPTIIVRDNGGNPVAGPLKSGGVELYYIITDNADGGQTLTAYKGMGGDVVFTLTLDPDAAPAGAFSFELANELDHPDADGQNRLDLSFGFIARDGDDDTANSTIVIRIVDDVPYVVGVHDNLITNGDFLAGTWSSPAWWGSVAQPGNVPGWSISGDILFPPQNGIQFERQAPGFLGLHSSTGNGLIDMGGSPGNYVLSQSVGAGAAPDLTAGKQYVLQVEVGAPFPATALMQVYWNGQLIGTIDTNVSSGQMEKFAFIVEGTGNPATDVITFREIGTGNADLGNAPNGQDLQTEGYHGTYIANVQMYELNGVVDEDALLNGIGDNQPGDAQPDIVKVSGSLGVKWGSDDTDEADIGGIQDGANGPALIGRHLTFTDTNISVFGTNVLKSDGQTVSFALTHHGTRLVGYIDTGDAGYQEGVDHLVFDVTLQDDGNGSFTFNLYDNLDHAPGAHENDIALKFNFTATDFDGDTATGSFFVGIDDDMPEITQAAGTQFTVVHDESALAQNDADDISGIGPNLQAALLFVPVPDKGDDPDALLPLGFARSSGPVVSFGVDYGADGQGAPVSFSLVPATDGTPSGLKITEGQDILLYQETHNGIDYVVGRVSGGAFDGEAAFALHIDANGFVTMAQWLSIFSTDPDPLQHDELDTLLSGSLFVQVTVQDGDGDVRTKDIDISGQIGFQDDGPQAFDAIGRPSLHVASLDDESINNPDSPGITGGPGDDGNGRQLSGLLVISAGRDGLKQIEVSQALKVYNSNNALLAGPLMAIWVDASGYGHQREVQIEWTQNGVGGTLKGTALDLNNNSFDVFTLTVNANGSYTLMMHAPLAHPFTDPDGLNNGQEISWEDNLRLVFDYTVTDGDNDTDQATLTVMVDDDSPKFVNGGIADETITTYDPVTNSLNLGYGSDGQKITYFSELPDLSAFGITYIKNDPATEVIAKLPNGDVFFTIKLNGNGTYTFDLVTLPDFFKEEFQPVQFNSGFNPELVKDFIGFKLLNGFSSGNPTVINGSGQGFGVGNNSQIQHGDKFDILFDAPMTSVTLGVNHNGGGSLALTWTAYGIGGNQVGTGTVNYSNDGSLTTGNLPPFVKLVISAAGDHNAHLRISSIDGSSVDLDDLQYLDFAVTGVDGDGDGVTDPFTITLGDALFPPPPPQLSLDGNIVHDESAGLQNGGGPTLPPEDNNDQDVTGTQTAYSSGSIASLFTGFDNAQVGHETDLPGGALDNSDADQIAIGYARSNILDVSAAGAGVTRTFELTIAAAGTPAGVTTTEGAGIFLFVENGVVVGRVGAVSGPGYVPNASGTIAFAIAINPGGASPSGTPGEIFLVQYLSLHHNNGGASHDDSLSLVANAISVKVTDSKSSGVSSSAEIDIGGRIRFEDDGPDVDVVGATSVNEGGSISNGTWTLAEGADGVTEVEVTIGNVTKTLSLAVLNNTVTFTAADGAFGTLIVNANKTWTYAAGNVSGNQSFSFSVKATDGDGDWDTDSHTIRVNDVAGGASSVSLVGTAPIYEDNSATTAGQRTNDAANTKLTISFNLKVTPTDPNDDVDSATIGGIPAGATATVTLSNSNVLTVTNGTVTRGGSADGDQFLNDLESGVTVLITLAEHDSADVTLTLSAVVDGTATAQDDATAVVDTVAADPTLDDPADDPQVEGSASTTFTLTITANFADLGDNEFAQVLFGDLPTGWSVTSVMQGATTLAGGSTALPSGLVDPAHNVGYTAYNVMPDPVTGNVTLTVMVTAPGNVNDNITKTLDIVARAYDVPTDAGELTLANNVAVATQSVDLTVTDTSVTSNGGTISVLVKEAALDTTQDQSTPPAADLLAGVVTGTDPDSREETDQESTGATFTAGADSFTVTFVNPTNVNDWVAPTVSGIATDYTISWALVGGQLVGTLYDPANNNLGPAIYLELSGQTSASNGGTATPTVTATLTDQLQHALVQGNNDITITGLRIVATEADGDKAFATVDVTVRDDVPVAYDNERELSESFIQNTSDVIESFASGSTSLTFAGNGAISGGQATMHTGTGSLSDTNLESAWGLTAGTLDTLFGNAREGSGLSKTFATTVANTQLTFNYNFDQVGGQTDIAFYILVNSLGVIVASGVIAQAADASGTIPTVTLAGVDTYKLLIGVVDSGNNNNGDSSLTIDNVTLTASVTVVSQVTGNLVTDSNEATADPSDQIDNGGADGFAAVTRIVYTAEGGATNQVALVPTDGSTVTVDTEHGLLTIDNTGAYTYVADVGAAPSGGSVQDTITYEIMDGDGDTDQANIVFNVDDFFVPPAGEPNLLNGTIVTNTNVNNQLVEITLTELGDARHSYSFQLLLNSQGQQNSAFTFAEDVGFDINPAAKYLVTMTVLNGGKVIVTDFTLEGVTIEDASGNIQLGFPSTGDGFAVVIDPISGDGTGGQITPPASIDYSGASLSPTGPTTAGAEAGQTVPYLMSSGTLNGDSGVNVIAGTGAGDTLNGGDETDVLIASDLGATLNGGGGTDALFGGAAVDTLNGGSGNDYLNGGAGNDILDGGADDDLLIGGAGNDTLTGGDGANTFGFGAGEYGTGNVDTIIDFSDADGDKLDLTGLLNGLYGGTQTGSAVQLDTSGSDVIVQVDIDTGAGADWQNVAVLQNYAGSEVDIVLNNMASQAQSYPV